MRWNRSYTLITIASLALLVVAVIQVLWIVQSAKVKEQIFNEKAGMVLSQTAQTLSEDTLLYKSLNGHPTPKQNQYIDSTIKYYMNFYNFHVDYTFQVKNFEEPPVSPAITEIGKSFTLFGAPVPAKYQQCLPPPDAVPEFSNWPSNKVELNLAIPDKQQFIRDELSTTFIASISLILIVLVLCWRTVISLLKEKEIFENTTDFLNNMTHEFKTPLTNIALAGRMITKEIVIKQEEKLRQYSGIILDENEKLRLQVEQVLSMTALERGEIPLHKSEIDMFEVIRDAVSAMQLQLDELGAKLELDFRIGNESIWGDRVHLYNVCRNLIDNALKYSVQKPELAIKSRSEGAWLYISFEDKGLGIDKKYQKKIFEKFFRVPTGNVHDVKGTGLGLAYIKRIVELHDGEIQLKSEPGLGSTFTIKLPNV